VEVYYSSDSSSQSLKQPFQLKSEAESHKTVVVSIMTTVTNKWKEEIANMKDMPKKLTEESKKDERCIKL